MKDERTIRPKEMKPNKLHYLHSSYVYMHIDSNVLPSGSQNWTIASNPVTQNTDQVELDACL